MFLKTHVTYFKRVLKSKKCYYVNPLAHIIFEKTQQYLVSVSPIFS